MTSWPAFDDKQIAVVERVLHSGPVNSGTGEEGCAFEREHAEACGREYGVALANGDLGLELAHHVLDIGPCDEVVVTPRSFMASASCVALRGATPVFADVDPESQNIPADAYLLEWAAIKFASEVSRSFDCSGLMLGQIEPAVRMLGTRQVHYSRLVGGRTLRRRMALTAQELRRSWH
jgi:DegT/DnrJ/EryC1/StrS aminotransferase family